MAGKLGDQLFYAGEPFVEVLVVGRGEIGERLPDDAFHFLRLIRQIQERRISGAIWRFLAL